MTTSKTFSEHWADCERMAEDLVEPRPKLGWIWVAVAIQFACFVLSCQ